MHEYIVHVYMYWRQDCPSGKVHIAAAKELVMCTESSSPPTILWTLSVFIECDQISGIAAVV